MTTLLNDATTVFQGQEVKKDILIEDGIIKEISDKIEGAFDEVIDCTGKYVLPGGIDVHTHMELPVMGTESCDDFINGTKAALAGGTTTIIDFANQEKGRTLTEAYEKWRSKGDNRSLCDWGLHLSITDVNETTLKEIEYFINNGITSFKTFLAYPQMKLDLISMKKVIKKVGSLGGIVTVHAEIGSIIEDINKKNIEENKTSPLYHPKSHPVEAETEAIKEMIKLSKDYNCPVYIVHLSSGDGVDLIRKAKKDGVKIYAETCPQYLYLDDSCYDQEFDQAAHFVLSPPIRTKNDNSKLLKGIYDGTIDTVATDHCPFTIEQRRAGIEDYTKIPNGGAGVQERVILLFQEFLNMKISLKRFVDLVATNPAKIFGMYPKRGTILENSLANIMIIDPNKSTKLSSKSIISNCNNSLYSNKYSGNIVKTIYSGNTTFLQRDLPILDN